MTVMAMRLCLLLVLVSAVSMAQTPSFDAASVKKHAGGGPPVVEIRVTPNGGFVATNVPLRVLVRESHRVQDHQIVGMPGWADRERFDIIARSAGPSPEWQPMVRTLLTERFALAARTETRDMPIYAAALVRGGRLGPKLQPTPAATAEYCLGQRRPEGQRPPAEPNTFCGTRQSIGMMSGRDVPLAFLWRAVAQQAGRAIVDRSGLTGNHDFDLTWTPEQFANRETAATINGNAIDPNGPSLFTALQEQLGLRLDAERGPADVLVIDRIDRPTEN